VFGRCQVVQTSWLFRDATFRAAYRLVWTAAGTFVPLTLLCVSSAGLVVVLYRSRTAAVAGSPRRYPCSRVTVTVTGVVLTFIVLVCPSMLLEVRDTLIIVVNVYKRLSFLFIKTHVLVRVRVKPRSGVG